MSSVEYSSTISALLKALAEKERQMQHSARAGVKAANKVYEATYRSLLSLHKSEGSPVRKDGTPRPHLADVVGSKVWRYPSGDGYAGFTGVKSSERMPHLHLVEHGTKFRMRVKIGGRYKIVETYIRIAAMLGFDLSWKRRTGKAEGLNLLSMAKSMGDDKAKEAIFKAYREGLKR